MRRLVEGNAPSFPPVPGRCRSHSPGSAAAPRARECLPTTGVPVVKSSAPGGPAPQRRERRVGGHSRSDGISPDAGTLFVSWRGSGRVIQLFFGAFCGIANTSMNF
jgi:hypothetical protein